VIVAYLLVIVTLFIIINLVVDILYSALDPRVRITEARGERGVPAARTSTSSRAVQTPFQRVVATSSPIRSPYSGWRCCSLVVLAALFAPMISPQNPYDLAQLDVMDSRLPPGSPAPTAGTSGWAPNDQGRDIAVRHLLRPAHFARGGRDQHRFSR
jgi:ABC-type dipeptide/oligopeptide/nickel transport system permease subunit